VIQLNRVLTWGLAALTTILAVLISVNFLDRPLAKFCYRIFGHLMIVREFAGTPSFFGPLQILVLLIFSFRRIALYPLAYPDAVLVLCEASLLGTKLLLSPMKFAFSPLSRSR